MAKVELQGHYPLPYLRYIWAYPKGFPQNPMSDADVEAKFRSCCAELLTAQQCDRALELLWSLEAQPNLKELFDNLVV
jgi:2-methylcitrate dehydratase PrpD